MKGIEGLILGGALFKKKKSAPSPQGEDARAREAAIRKKLVDDYRGREDALRDKEAELVAREEELKRSHSELALRLQETAAGGGAGGAAAGEHADGGAGTLVLRHGRTVHEQERLIRKMEEELGKARARFDEMVAQQQKTGEHIAVLNEYRAKGYVVSRLEAAMVRSPQEVRWAFERYAADLKKLSDLAAECDAMDPVFETEAAALKGRCNDPDAIGEVEKGLMELKAKVDAKRRLLMDRIGKWRSEGYVTSRFDGLKGAPLGALEEAVIKFDDDVGALRHLSDRLNGPDKALAPEAALLKKRLNDPDKIPELEREVLALQQRAGSQKQAPPAPQNERPKKEKKEERAETEAPAGAEASVGAAGSDGVEKELEAEFQASESIIKELDDARIDATSAANLLKLARSFSQRKNFAKALTYAKKAHETAEALKK